jgi:hypothetical protein
MNSREKYTSSLPEAREATLALLEYCRENEWGGHDPYDALNSRFFEFLPILDFRLSRIASTQILKRSPFDVRRLLCIPKTQNPKALALLLDSILKLDRLGLVREPELARRLIDRLVALRSPGNAHWCWGYSFPWQTRTLLVPRAAPSLVCTTFVGNALVDAFEHLGDDRCREMALSAADYILKELYWQDGDAAGFRYPTPTSTSRVHNANFLGAAFLARASRHGGEGMLVEAALRAARYSVSGQRADGSWFYGEGPTQRWIDNFHTGYNLCALRAIGGVLDTTEFEPAVCRGYAFYANNFLRKDGAVKYFHDRDYPVDGHCVAQSLITLATLRDLRADSLELAHRVLVWALAHMWDRRGFFYYRVHRIWTIKTSYMRWVQAWMLLAMSALLEGGSASAVQAAGQKATATRPFEGPNSEVRR